MQVVAACRDGGAVARRRRHAQGRARLALFRAVKHGEPRALRARPVRRLPLDRRRRARLDDGDVRRAATRDRELALGGRAVLHPHRQVSAGHPDRAAARLQAPAAARLRHYGTRSRGRTSSSSSSTRRPASGSIVDAHRADGPGPITLDMEFAEEGGEGADAVRGAAPRGADRRRARASPRQDARRRDLARDAAAARRAAAGARLRAGERGAPRRRTRSSASTARWHGPWIVRPT